VKFAIVVFPGSNCDHDAYHVAKHVLGQEAEFVWHKETQLGDADVVVLPGGFSYGDYLRSGAIARFAPIMPAVVEFATQGGPVLGICNGFQMLLELGLLEGAVLRNRDLKFLCQQVHLRVDAADTPFTSRCETGAILQMPIAHHDGSYHASPDALDRLERNRQIVFRYVDRTGGESDAANPNGSARSVAGLCNEARNVVGLMPHPERACESVLGSADGLVLFESVMNGLRTDALLTETF
jgi:phosphoribosylformylglycinamidine synthase